MFSEPTKAALNHNKLFRALDSGLRLMEFRGGEFTFSGPVFQRSPSGKCTNLPPSEIEVLTVEGVSEAPGGPEDIGSCPTPHPPGPLHV